MDVTSFILGFKKGAASGTGGGSVEGVHTVTFMSEDGSAVLYERYVADGDDCANVVDRGLLVAPTKASTAQYSYSHSGWSLTSGGSADASALKSVTADRTVYAAFDSVVIEYTVCFYDGETLLHTTSVPYGGTAQYNYKKTGYVLTGWQPSNENVTESRNCYAVLEETRKLADYTWEEIAAYSEAGEATRFELGDTKTFTFAGYKQDFTFECQLIGFNHDNLADGSGKAGMTFAVVDDGEYFSNSTYMNDTGTAQRENASWPDTSGYRRVCTTSYLWGYIEASSIGSLIKQVSKKYRKYRTTEYPAVAVYTWQLSASEIGFSINADEGDVYELFTSGKEKGTSYTELVRQDGKAYWTRTKESSDRFYMVDTNGVLSNYSQASSIGSHSIGFCI